MDGDLLTPPFPFNIALSDGTWNNLFTIVNSLSIQQTTNTAFLHKHHSTCKDDPIKDTPSLLPVGDLEQLASDGTMLRYTDWSSFACHPPATLPMSIT